MGQGRRPLGGRLGRRNEPSHLGGAPFGEALGHDLQTAADAGQQVVEVVGDAAGQLADGLHFLRLAKRGLAGHQFGGALLDGPLQRLRQLGEMALGPTTFPRRQGAFADVPEKPDLILLPGPHGGVIQIGQGDHAPLFRQGHVDHGARRERFQHVRILACARILARVGEGDGVAALQVLDVGTIVAEVQNPRDGFDPGRIPIAGDGDGFVVLIHDAEAGAADLEGPPQDFGGGIGDVLGILEIAQDVRQLHHRRTQAFGPHPIGDVGRDPRDAQRSALGVRHQYPPSLHPAHAAQGRDNAVSDMIVRAVLDRRIALRAHRLPVVGMDHLLAVFVGEGRIDRPAPSGSCRRRRPSGSGFGHRRSRPPVRRPAWPDPVRDPAHDPRARARPVRP